MNSEVALAAAIGCSLCNAIAAILQKVGSDKVTKIHSYNLSVLVKLSKQMPYVVGLLLDLIAGILTLVAVSKLPIFIVQALIASSVLLTAILEKVFLKRKFHTHIYIASLIVMLGLAFLAYASHNEGTAYVSSSVQNIIIFLPIALAVIGGFAISSKGKTNAPLLAGLSGICFGFVSIVGRIIVYPNPFWMVLNDPLIWSLLLYGGIGMYFFTAALQRTLATISNGIMISTQTLIPTIIGITLLGDTARNGLWALVWAGCLLVAGGCVYIALND